MIFLSVLSNVKHCLKTVENPVVRERLLMVQATCEMPLREAAGKFGCTHGKVDFWKKRFRDFGVHGLRTKPKAGRPRKISVVEELDDKKNSSRLRKNTFLKKWSFIYYYG